MSSRKEIHIDTITRHFVDFAKIMGIFPEISIRFLNETQYAGRGLSYLGGQSFYDYARWQGRYYKLLSDNLIKDVYFFPFVWYYRYRLPNIKDIDLFVSLFVSYLRDKGIIRYIRVFGTY
jgi:hypothetical protein